MQEAVAAHVARRLVQLGDDKLARAFLTRMASTLYKWELMRLGDEYDAILFTDLDVDMMPSGVNNAAAVRERWVRTLPRLRRRGVRLVATADAASPVNAGVMLLLPPRRTALYTDGIQTLHAPFSTRHGWNLSGTPARLFASRTLRQTSGGVLMHEGRPAEVDNGAWDFVGGDIDQGFFFYMLHVRAQAGLWADDWRDGGVHVVHHYWNQPKPWVQALSSGIDLIACSEPLLWRSSYLRRVGLPLQPPADSAEPATPCLRAFRGAWAALRPNVSCCASQLASMLSGDHRNYPHAEGGPF